MHYDGDWSELAGVYEVPCKVNVDLVILGSGWRCLRGGRSGCLRFDVAKSCLPFHFAFEVL